jgi:hypothetical protein
MPIYPENFLVCPEKFFEMTSPPSPTFPGKKFYMPFFIRKVPLKAWPPELLEASYAPDSMNIPMQKIVKDSYKTHLIRKRLKFI